MFFEGLFRTSGLQKPTHSSSWFFFFLYRVNFSWDGKVCTVSDIQLYQSLALPKIELFCVYVCGQKKNKLCAPLR